MSDAQDQLIIQNVHHMSVSDHLRSLADQIDNYGQFPDTCVVVTAGAGQVAMVHAAGEEISSEEIIATLAKGSHIMMNAIMPFAVQSGCEIEQDG